MTKITRATFLHLVESLDIPGGEKANAVSDFDKAKSEEAKKALYDSFRRGTTRGKSIQTK